MGNEFQLPIKNSEEPICLYLIVNLLSNVNYLWNLYIIEIKQFTANKQKFGNLLIGKQQQKNSNTVFLYWCLESPELSRITPPVFLAAGK
ncbi:MAG: hypothetical protein ACP5N0_10465, partial [Methanosarcina sp.]